jgi:hypothetical protein
VILLPVAIFFIQKVPAEELYYYLVKWPLLIQPKYGSLPYPALLPNPVLLFRGDQSLGSYFLTGLMRVPFYFALGVFVMSAITLAIGLRRWSPANWGMLLTLLFGITCFNLAMGRSDLAHFYPTTIPALILISPLLSQSVAGKGKKVLRPLVILSVLLLVCSLGVYIWKGIPPAKEQLASPNLKRARGIYLHPSLARELEEAVKFVNMNSSGDDRIFVGNVRHDEGAINDIMFYFLAERRSATKFFALAPGLVTTEVVQKQIVHDLENYEVDYVIIWLNSKKYLTAGQAQAAPNGERVRILDHFIQRNYLPIQKFGNYLILHHKDPLQRTSL